MRGAALTARRAGSLLLSGDELEALVDAAWLHDVGYACPRTGFHSLDGADLLRERGWPPRVAALVAHHSFARLVAVPAGMDEQLSRYPLETGLVADLLVYADMSVEPAGESVLLEQRLGDIARRHVGRTPTGDVHEDRARLITAAVRRVDAALLSRYACAATA
jgi:hypothetical protein